MNKQERDNYKKKYNKIKEYIKRDFISYDKEFSLNELTGYYQVYFIVDDRLINFTILPNCIYSEFKQKIERNLSNLSTIESECKICFNHNKSLTFCKQCSIEICIDCFEKIKKSSDFFSCPQCKYVPYNETKKDTTKNQIPSVREQYMPILQFALQSHLEYQFISQLLYE